MRVMLKLCLDDYFDGFVECNFAKTKIKIIRMSVLC